MRPDEWQQGMENEAASVEDVSWAQETYRAACWRRFGANLGLAGVCFGLLAAAQVLAVQVVFATEPPTSLWGAALALVGLVSSCLGWRGRTWSAVGAVGLAVLIYFPAAWLSVLLLQWQMPGRAVFSPGFPDEGAWVLLLVGVCSAGLLNGVRVLLGRRASFPSGSRKMTP